MGPIPCCYIIDAPEEESYKKDQEQAGEEKTLGSKEGSRGSERKRKFSHETKPGGLRCAQRQRLAWKDSCACDGNYVTMFPEHDERYELGDHEQKAQQQQWEEETEKRRMESQQADKRATMAERVLEETQARLQEAEKKLEKEIEDADWYHAVSKTLRSSIAKREEQSREERRRAEKAEKRANEEKRRAEEATQKYLEEKRRVEEAEKRNKEETRRAVAAEQKLKEGAEEAKGRRKRKIEALEKQVAAWKTYGKSMKDLMEYNRWSGVLLPASSFEAVDWERFHRASNAAWTSNDRPSEPPAITIPVNASGCAILPGVQWHARL
jgi:hypothetical protein